MIQRHGSPRSDISIRETEHEASSLTQRDHPRVLRLVRLRLQSSSPDKRCRRREDIKQNGLGRVYRVYLEKYKDTWMLSAGDLFGQLLEMISIPEHSEGLRSVPSSASSWRVSKTWCTGYLGREPSPATVKETRLALYKPHWQIWNSGTFNIE
jgi:hypothetical protein